MKRQISNSDPRKYSKTLRNSIYYQSFLGFCHISVYLHLNFVILCTFILNFAFHADVVSGRWAIEYFVQIYALIKQSPTDMQQQIPTEYIICVYQTTTRFRFNKNNLFQKNTGLELIAFIIHYKRKYFVTIF